MNESKETAEKVVADAKPTSRYVLFAILAAGGCLADLLSKSIVFRWRGMPGEMPIWWLWEGKIGVETSLNTGALFGLGQDRVLLFAAFSFVALIGIVVWFAFFGGGRDLVLTFILGCVTGGILGNLYDRLGLWDATFANPTAASLYADEYPRHAVRDWIRLSYDRYVWPNFNIADCLLVVGAAALVWHSYFMKPAARNSGPNTADSVS